MAGHRADNPVQRVMAAIGPLARQLVPRTRNQRIAAAASAGVVLIVVGLLIAFLPGSPKRIPPSPSRPSAVAQVPRASLTTPRTTTRSSAKPKPSCSAPARDQSVAGTTPLRVCIPAIGVQSDLLQLGLNDDRTVQVPTLAQVRLAGWYKYSPAPGVTGPAVILGHVDSAQYGKGVFFDLVKLHSGDQVTFYRADGRRAIYRVDRVQQFPKSSFPTQLVYGDTSNAQMRLITCGGTFDPQARSYEDNIIAFGTLVSLK